MTEQNSVEMDKNETRTNVDFSSLVSGFMTEAMAFMGILAHPAMKGVKKDLKHAQYVINTLSMLKEKTAGNLTQQESDMLEEVLHQLRMGYVSASKDEETAADGGPGSGDVT